MFLTLWYIIYILYILKLLEEEKTKLCKKLKSCRIAYILRLHTQESWLHSITKCTGYYREREEEKQKDLITNLATGYCPFVESKSMFAPGLVCGSSRVCSQKKERSKCIESNKKFNSSNKVCSQIQTFDSTRNQEDRLFRIKSGTEQLKLKEYQIENQCLRKSSTTVFFQLPPPPSICRKKKIDHRISLIKNFMVQQLKLSKSYFSFQHW